VCSFGAHDRVLSPVEVPIQIEYSRRHPGLIEVTGSTRKRFLNDKTQ
jgi:hypothetical protein